MQQIAREGQKANEHNRQVHLDEQRVAQELEEQRQEELERQKKLEEWQARTGQGGKKDDESSEKKEKKDEGSE
jgi:hypothetical protein